MYDYVLESLQAGGWVLIPIVLTSVIGWYLGIKLWMDLSGIALSSRRIHKHAKTGAALVKWVETMKASERKTMAGGILTRVWEVHEQGERMMLEVIDEELRFYRPRLENGMSTITSMGAAAPLLGLLGTVSGMVGTFETISIFGAGNPALMADSISEALVTTQNGLLAALPLMLLHNVLWNRSLKIEKDAIKSAQRLVNYLIHRDLDSRLRL